ncbi:MAG: hypothetical protein Q9227_005472 [Pyrenula ochraceoflavens]
MLARAMTSTGTLTWNLRKKIKSSSDFYPLTVEPQHERARRSDKDDVGDVPMTGDVNCTLRNAISSQLDANKICSWLDAGSIRYDPRFSEELDDIHPAFWRGKLQATESYSILGPCNSLPIGNTIYDRMRPALTLASRALVDKRYLRFWASLVQAADKCEPIPLPWRERLIHEAELTQELAAKTHSKVLEATWYLDRVVFTDLSRMESDKYCAGLLKNSRRREALSLQIYLNEPVFRTILTDDLWDCATIPQRKSLLFYLTLVLLHEFAHAFTHFIFRTSAHSWPIFYGEPIIDGLHFGGHPDDGYGEVGHAWDSFFLGDGNDQLMFYTEPEPHHNEIGNLVSPAWLVLQPRGAIPYSWMPEDARTSPIFAEIPLHWLEARFQEWWFEKPYPRWQFENVQKLICPAPSSDSLRSTLKSTHDLLKSSRGLKQPSLCDFQIRRFVRRYSAGKFKGKAQIPLPIQVEGLMTGKNHKHNDVALIPGGSDGPENIKLRQGYIVFIFWKSKANGSWRSRISCS